jgi:hypothetical protein
MMRKILVAIVLIVSAIVYSCNEKEPEKPLWKPTPYVIKHS